MGGGVVMILATPWEPDEPVMPYDFDIFRSTSPKYPELVFTGFVAILVGGAMLISGYIERRHEQHAKDIPKPVYVVLSETGSVEPDRPPPLTVPAAKLSIDNPRQRQLAIQASSAARRGDCSAARASSKDLERHVLTSLHEIDGRFATCYGPLPVAKVIAPKAPDPTEQAREANRNRATAFSILQQARIAAADGDCARVKDYERRVLDLDAEFHTTVFRNDQVLARCLQQ